MNEKQFQLRLWYSLHGHEYICPNYYPPFWFECDIFSLTTAGYFYEHEIKLTKSDFKADASKKRKIYKQPERTKYELLQEGVKEAPVCFYYVCPNDLLTPEDIPDFAGLKYISEDCWHVREIKKAPRLHDHKYEIDINSFYKTFYWRYWNFFRKEYCG
jgi:hypothetical protein